MISNTVQEAVERLLAQYSDYKKLLIEEQAAGRVLARQLALGVGDSKQQKKHEVLQLSLRRLSDAMTFASPSVWIEYKYRAYQSEVQPILTLGDFRQHCAQPGYICTKRYTFVNTALRALGNISLDDDRFRDDTSLDLLIEQGICAPIEASSGVMQQWNEYEYYAQNATVMKWQNYKESNT